MEAIFACLLLLYCLLIVYFHYYWLQIPVFQPRPDFSYDESVSQLTVIIPVRNEARHIVHLLEDLQQQTTISGLALPTNNWEVIVVDDDSEDETVALIRQFQARASYSIRLLSSNASASDKSPKKKALWTGIQHAQGNIIVTTDGDCRVGPNWLATWIQFFQEKNPAMAAGGVTFYQERTWFQRLQTLEFASLIGIGAAGIQSKIPITCNGANLAFSKRAFIAVNGYEGHWHIPSGDDEFLLHAMYNRFPGQVYFLKSSLSVVQTEAKRRFADFFQQRKRWAGKWKMHHVGQTAVVAFLVFLYHVAFLYTSIFSIVDLKIWHWLVWLLLLKVGLEYVFLKSVSRFLKKEVNLLNFLGLQLLYSAYFVLIGIVATFGGYTWKNRKYAKHDGFGVRRDG